MVSCGSIVQKVLSPKVLSLGLTKYLSGPTDSKLNTFLSARLDWSQGAPHIAGLSAYFISLPEHFPRWNVRVTYKRGLFSRSEPKPGRHRCRARNRPLPSKVQRKRALSVASLNYTGLEFLRL